MTNINFMLQDILSTILGFFLFPLVLIVPGYVIGWWLDLFDFRRRLLHSRLALALLLSFTVSPILFYLSTSLFSYAGTSIMVLVLFLICVGMLFHDKPVFPSMRNKAMIWVIACAGIWIVFALFSLVDIQWGEELYYSVAGFDHATRISIVDAMARTGVPPVNPSYFPGQPVKLSFLYFFWYILGGFIDFIGGSLVDARGAFFASAIWCGLGLMAAISFYLRLRSKEKRLDVWALAVTGIGLLTVTGLDFFPAILIMSNLKTPIADIEHWNEQVSAWMSSLLWVPHHIAALVAGVVAVMLVLSLRDQTKKRQFILMAVAGAAFASAFGLSIWVTFVFVLFWGICLLRNLWNKADRSFVFPMVFAGFFALLLSAGFLAGIFSGLGSATASGGGLPIIFDVRSFIFVDIVAEESPRIIQTILRLLFLPLNYFLEFGFYFLVPFIWFRQRRHELNSNQYLVELFLFCASFLIGTFMRSTLIVNNDLGWRSWLPGQFILLIWGVDVLASFKTNMPTRTQANLIFLLIFGLLSTLLNLGLLRFEPILAGSEFGARSLSARKAYTTILQTLPTDIVVQYNPVSYVNRPAGLYGMRQSAISDRTAYGISTDIFLERVAEVGEIFTLKDVSSWQPVDNFCEQNFIDVLVIEDTDTLWESIAILKTDRQPHYLDDTFAVFSCGSFAASQLP
ncbi:MAG: hypothetical protein J0M11_10565 [Anaerolineae bacterium]|nr:hypothetical protein [Anaerolineae bacterium]